MFALWLAALGGLVAAGMAWMLAAGVGYAKGRRADR